MATILIILASIFIAALGLRAYKRIRETRHQVIVENEYNAAVTLWNYARLVKSKIGETIRDRKGVIDFYHISVPHSPGYRLSLELNGYDFRVHAIPERYQKTGRLSFYTDAQATVRASDNGGRHASEQDPEYEGEAQASEAQ
jgi:hypothetical protein